MSLIANGMLDVEVVCGAPGAGKAKRGTARGYRRGHEQTRHAGTEVDLVDDASFWSVRLHSRIKYDQWLPDDESVSINVSSSRQSVKRISHMPARGPAWAYHQQACVVNVQVVSALAEQ